MILIANGCSWTYGGGIDNGNITRQELDQLTWPKHLADNLHATTFVNLADGCGSNQRIFRTTLNYLLDNKFDEDVIAVIQFTEESRYEYYYPLDISNYVENIEGRWMKAKTTNLTPEIVDNFSTHYQLSQQRIKYHNSYIQNIYTYIEHCEALANLFNQHNIKYYFWDMDDVPARFPAKFQDYVYDKFNWLQKHDDSIFWDYWEYDRVSQDDLHPSIIGHKQLADIIYNKIKKDL